MKRTSLAMAMDKSTRTYDQDGHLRVLDNVLTAAGISPYLGSELPNADKLGLSQNRVYQMLRPASELEQAASSLAGKPIPIKHTAISSADRPHTAVCGAVGTDVVFDGSVVKGSLNFWTDESIAAIESGEQRDVSAGYWFEPVMTPGTYQGKAYDGIMKRIRFNHLAVVVDGRVEGAMVGDSAARIKRAMDEDDDDDAPDVVAQDPHSALCIWLADQLPPDQLDTAHTLIEDMMKWATGDDGWAADSNVYTGQNMMNTTAIVRRIQAVESAKLAVRPYIGDVHIACDSADAVYIHALAALGHPTAELELHPGSATAVWPALKGKPAGTPGQPTRRPAMDAASTKRFNEMFPNAGRLLKGGYYYGDGQKPATLVTQSLYNSILYSLTTSGCGMCLPVSLVMAKQIVAELERISPQREALAKAIANYKQAQADYAVAETAANDAENARWRVLSEIEDAADKLRQAKRMQDPDRIFVCEEALRQAQPTELPARAAVVAAKEKSEIADVRLREAEYQIRPAVDEVLRSEMAPAVEEILAEFQAAQAKIIACGTSIQNIYEQSLAPREGALKTAYHELFTNPAGWPGFYERYKWDPFRHVATVLSQDAAAPVPTGPL